MKAKIKLETSSLRTDLIRLSKVHFVYAGVTIAQIILYHTSKLITPELVKQRWMITAGLLFVTILVWYAASTKKHSTHLYRWLILALISVDITVAAFSVYTDRGFASQSVLLFIIPIVVSAVLKSRAALFATAAVCIAVYSTTALKYFVDFFNEGYSAELYGEVGFYSAIFLVIASMLAAVLHTRQKS